MVGINLNGIVQGRELNLIANEILNKAKSHNSSAKADKSPKTTDINPLQEFQSSIGEFVPQETKTAKAGYEQSTLEIDPNLKKTVNAKAAIDRYSLFATKNSSKMPESFAGEIPDNGIEINSAKKDRKSKNPFAFLYNLPEAKQGNLNEDQLRSIFETIADKNHRVF